MNSIGERLSRSWELFKRSVRVISEHPKLLVFPVFTGICTLTIALFFLVPVALTIAVPTWIAGSAVQSVADHIGFLRFDPGSSERFQLQPIGSAILAVMYLVNLFLATMGGVAFNSEIIEALSGREVSIRHGVRVALDRWQAVLLWSLMAGLVGLLIRALEERLAFVGRLVAGMLGLAWSVAAIFAIPILVRDPGLRNPFEVLKQSASTIRKTWGEMLTGYVGMRGMNFVVFVLSVLFWVMLGGAAIALSNAWILLPGGLAWLVAIVGYSYLASVASRVYVCALYLYAAEGTISGHYDAALMEMAWKRKKSNSTSL